MDLTSLKIFCDLVETQSFTQAADRGYMSQSAVSQRVRALEREYGQVLLERGRGKGRIAPTEAGRVLYDGAKPLLAEAAELDARLRGLSDTVAGAVRVATVYSVGLHALPARLKAFLAGNPAVSVHLEYSPTQKVYRDVASAAVDVGIVACPSEQAGIDVVPFGSEEMVLVCAPEHPLASQRCVSLSQLQGVPFIAFSRGIPTRSLVDRQLAELGVRVSIAMEFDNVETVKNLVEIGSGVSLLPASVVRQEVRDGTLAAVPLAAAESFRRPIGILLRRGRTRGTAVRAFVAAMRRDEPEPNE